MNGRIKAFLRQKQVNKYVFLLSFIFYMATGLLLVLHDAQLMKYTPYILLATSAYMVISSILKLIINNSKSLPEIAELCAGVISFFLIMVAPEFAGILLSILITLWCFIVAFIRFVTAFQCRKDRTKGVISNILLGTFMAAMGILKISAPKMNFRLLASFIGSYFCIYAVTLLDEFIMQCIHANKPYFGKRRMRIQLPSFLSAFLPMNFVKEMRKAIQKGTVDPKELVVKKNEEPADLEVLIHTTDIWPSMGGHVDFAIGDKVISYGNYDDSSSYLMGLAGEGVMEIIDRNPYVKFCVSYSKKIIVSFGLCLNDEEKQRLQQAVEAIFEKATPWNPPAEEFKEKGDEPKAREATDYASELYKATDADFFKFVTGSKYKSYFGLYMNCARVADDILGGLGFDKFPLSSIFSPGVYLNYFNNEFLRKDSIVVSKTVYTPQTILELT